jgi:hypothetical protein
MRFRNWEAREVGAKCVDCGFDFIELGGCEWRGIVGGIRKGLSIKGWEGLLNVGGAR